MARDVMNPHPPVLRATDKVPEGARIIMEHRYCTLPVVDEEGRFLGVFGVNCLLRLVLPEAALVREGLRQGKSTMQHVSARVLNNLRPA